eukprot:scaffold70171_cov22-Tisochrysis_lutea.AAC.1
MSASVGGPSAGGSRPSIVTHPTPVTLRTIDVTRSSPGAGGSASTRSCRSVSTASGIVEQETCTAAHVTPPTQFRRERKSKKRLFGSYSLSTTVSESGAATTWASASPITLADQSISWMVASGGALASTTIVWPADPSLKVMAPVERPAKVVDVPLAASIACKRQRLRGSSGGSRMVALSEPIEAGLTEMAKSAPHSPAANGCILPAIGYTCRAISSLSTVAKLPSTTGVAPVAYNEKKRGGGGGGCGGGSASTILVMPAGSASEVSSLPNSALTVRGGKADSSSSSSSGASGAIGGSDDAPT